MASNVGRSADDGPARRQRRPGRRTHPRTCARTTGRDFQCACGCDLRVVHPEVGKRHISRVGNGEMEPDRLAGASDGSGCGRLYQRESRDALHLDRGA